MPVSLDFFMEVARGKIPGWSRNLKYGRRAIVDEFADYHIWEGTAAAYTGYLTAASAVRIKAGGNAADTAAGAGAQSVTIEGLDATGVEASATVATAGALASAATTTTFSRVFRAYVPDGGVGTYGGTNTGAITIETTAGVEVAAILAGRSQTQMCLFTVPLGMKAHIREFVIDNQNGKEIDVKLWARNDALDVTTPFSPARLKAEYAQDTSRIWRKYDIFQTFDALTDIWVTAKMEPGKSGSVTAEIEYLLETL